MISRRTAGVRPAPPVPVSTPSARPGEKLAEVAAQIRAAGRNALTLEVDLSESAAATQVIERTRAEFGRIDALLNIAGAVAGLDLFQLTDQQWDDGFALKFHGARRLTLQAWEALRESKGAVVFMPGNAAVTPRVSGAAVAAINAAIEALAKAFADRGIQDGAQVNSVSPGAVMTGRRLHAGKTGDAAKHQPR